MLPQFDTSWYVGEVFWLFLTFGLLYLGVRYFIFPMVQDVFVERDQLIENDLTIANMVNKRAESLIKDYNAHILSAEESRAEIINETYQDIQKFSVHVEAEHDDVFRQQLDEAEKKMQETQLQFKKESEIVAAKIAEQLASKFDNSSARVIKDVL